MVEFKSKVFVGILAAIMISNLIIGLFMLLLGGNLIYIPGMLLAVLILVLLYMKDEYLVLCIKIWAGILSLGGFAGLFSTGCKYVHVAAGGTKYGPEDYGVGKILLDLLQLGSGLYYFFYAGDYIVRKKTETVESTTSE